VLSGPHSYLNHDNYYLIFFGPESSESGFLSVYFQSEGIKWY